MCTLAATALAASIADAAICSGVTGTAGFLPGVSADPVTAQEIITLRDTTLPPSRLIPSAYNAAPDRDTGSRRMTRQRSLPLLWRCAKPRLPASATESEARIRLIFRIESAPCGDRQRRGRQGFWWNAPPPACMPLSGFSPYRRRLGP